MPKKKKRQAGSGVKEKGQQGIAASSSTKGKYTVDQLLDKAEECIDTYNFEVAQKFCQRALELDCDNIRALETSGTLLLECGNAEAAKQCFGRAVELSPEEGHAKYMYLGQLFEGGECVQYFQKGIELMSKQKLQQEQLATEMNGAASNGMPGNGDVTCRDISDAYLSIAEVYFTDKCDEANAEDQCKANIEEAIKADATNPEAYRLLADYFLVKDDKEKAREMVKKSTSLWLTKAKAAADGNVPDDEFDPVDIVQLSYQSRVKAVRILIEVEEYEEATDVLDLLLDEEDEVTDVWYLLGWLNCLQGDDYKGNARYYLQKAKEVAEKFPSSSDEQMSKHIEELLIELGPEPEEAADEEANGECDIRSSDEEEPMED